MRRLTLLTFMRTYLQYGMITDKHLKEIVKKAELGDNPILVKLAL